MFRFKGFKVYKDAKEFASFCETILQKINFSHKGLIYQIRSAYLSIILNIAEGSACDSDKEFRRFLEISLRSTHEVVAAFDVALELKLVDDKIINKLEEKAENLCKQLNGFRKTLKK
ncbi:MAG: four helix bundle protein [bacterium]|nr:four helix bundle protein [Candidatus Margulisiibacteriota bacterium]